MPQFRVLRITAVLALLAMASVSAEAQAPRIQWIRQHGTNRIDQGNAVGYGEFGVYVAGQTLGVFPSEPSAGANDRDAFISLHDEAGNLKWIRQFGADAPGEDNATGVAGDGSGAYVVGYTRGAFRSQISAGAFDAFIRKYGPDGNELWTRQFGTTADDYVFAVATHTSGVYVVGFIDCCNASLSGLPVTQGADVLVRKYDGNGNELWTRVFGTGDVDKATAVAVDDTGVYVAGTTTGRLVSIPGQRDGFVRKFDHSGATLWTQQFGATASNGNTANEDVYAIAAGPSGVYVAGATALGVFQGNTFAGGLWDAFVMKFSPGGVPQWTRQFGTNADDYAYGIAVGPGHVLVTGGTSGALPGLTYAGGEDAFLRLYDFDGNALGTQQFGNGLNDSGRGAVPFPGGFFVGGFKNGASLNGTAIGDDDAFAMKVIPPPYIPAGGVLNAASFAASPAPLAPGSMAVVFGNYLNDGPQVLSTTIGPDGKVVTELGGTKVTVNNVPAPMLYSIATQVAIQIPVEMAGQSTASVVVSVGGLASAPRTINIASSAPGIFTQNQAGTGDAVVVHEDGVTLVTPRSPAKRNEVVIVYLTGLGLMNPALGTGVPAGVNTAAAPVTVAFAAVNGVVEYAGTAPGFVGLDQVNVRVPATATLGGDVPLLLSSGGRAANLVTVAIGQ